MTQTDAGAVFKAFREAVLDDVLLMMWLRRPMERDAYVAHVVAAAAERGFAVDATAVWTALREGETTWLKQGGDAA